MATPYYEIEGPWGGIGGNPWTERPYTNITGITISSTEKSCIDAIAVRYSIQDHAVSGTGDEVSTIDFGNNEYLIQISGHYGDYCGFTVIKSLTLITNITKYGPFGSTNGTEFTSSGKGKIIGFHGSSGILLDSLGVYSLKVTPYYEIEGPWGGIGGNPWTEGPYTNITGIAISSTEKSCIDAIAVRYSIQDHAVSGTGDEVSTIDFGNNEYLIQISGHYGDYCGFTVIKSLTLITNITKYGPFGSTNGTEFTSSGKGKIIGFHGSSGLFLDSLGVYSLED